MRKLITICIVGMMMFLIACGNENMEKQHETNVRETEESEIQSSLEQTNTQTEEELQEEVLNKTETDIEDTEYESQKETTSVAEKKEQIMTVEINGQTFQAQLYDNDTANAFRQMLPVTFSMDEHNGNEKYIYMDQSLPSASETIGTIQNGDIMLFGSDCLVVFYESFQTSYTYTRIGKILDPDELADALGSRSVEVSFYME